MINQSESNNSDNKDYAVCGCNNVWHDEIVRAIEQGADSVEAIQAKTLASTGCGSCKPEVQKILSKQISSGCCGNRKSCAGSK